MLASDSFCMINAMLGQRTWCKITERALNNPKERGFNKDANTAKVLDEMDDAGVSRVDSQEQFFGFRDSHSKALKKMERKVTDKALTLTMKEFDKLYAAHPKLKSAAADEMSAAVDVEKQLGHFSAIDKHKLTKTVGVTKQVGCMRSRRRMCARAVCACMHAGSHKCMLGTRAGVWESGRVGPCFRHK